MWRGNSPRGRGLWTIMNEPGHQSSQKADLLFWAVGTLLSSQSLGGQENNFIYAEFETLMTSKWIWLTAEYFSLKSRRTSQLESRLESLWTWSPVVGMATQRGRKRRRVYLEDGNISQQEGKRRQWKKPRKGACSLPCHHIETGYLTYFCS